MLNRKKSKGQSIVEYALILALVSVVCVTSLGSVKDGIDAAVVKINAKLSS